MKKVRMGLVGLGYIGKIHLRNSARLKSTELTAVCDLSKNALSYARKRGIKKTYEDFKEMLRDDDIDAIVISLPTFLHESCARYASEAGRDIFIEKPLARDEKEGKKILAAASKNGVKLMVGYPFRFTVSFADLKQQIENGFLGDVQTAYSVLLGSGPFFHRSETGNPKPVPEWWFNKEMTGGGALLDLGCHLVNLVRWYFGDVTDVRSVLGHRYNLELEDYATCIIRFKSGTLSTINVGWFSQQSLIKVEVHGTVTNSFAQKKPSSKILTAIQQLIGKAGYWEPYVSELEHFADCIIHDLDPLTSGEDSIKDLAVIRMAYENFMHLNC